MLLRESRDAKSLIARSDELIARLGRLWSLSRRLRDVDVKWSSRLKRTLGTAYPERMQVRLSLLLCQSPCARNVQFPRQTASGHATFAIACRFQSWTFALCAFAFGPTRGQLLDSRV